MTILSLWEMAALAGLLALFVWLLLSNGVVVAVGVTVLVALGLFVALVIVEFSRIWFNRDYGSRHDG